MKKSKITVILIFCILIMYIACIKRIEDAPNTPPVVHAGNDTIVLDPDDFVFLNGVFTDDDATSSTFLWKAIPGNNYTVDIETPTSLRTKVSRLTTGKYQFELTVTDKGGLTGKDTVEINTFGKFSVVSAGGNQVILLPITEGKLMGSTILSPDKVLKKEWKKIKGPNVKIVSPNEFTSQIIDLEEGVYDFELLVTDTRGIIRKASSSITVMHAGGPNLQISPLYTLVYLPTNFTTLSAEAWSNFYSQEPVTKTEWTKISGSSSFNIENPLNKDTKISGLQQGVYEIKCEATDARGKTTSANTTIAVVDSSSPKQEIIIPDVPYSDYGGGFACAYLEEIKLDRYIPAGKPVKNVYIKTNCWADWVEINIIRTSPLGYPVYEYNIVAGKLIIEHCNDGCGSDPAPDIKIVY